VPRMEENEVNTTVEDLPEIGVVEDLTTASNGFAAARRSTARNFGAPSLQSSPGSPRRPSPHLDKAPRSVFKDPARVISQFADGGKPPLLFPARAGA
jgi:hypothetical protein